LETIRELNLTHKQLVRLGQLFAEEPTVDTDVCAKAHNAIASVGEMVFEGISAETLRHSCVCPDCRELLYEDRRRRYKELAGSMEDSTIPCDAVSATDIFDYVLPYGINSDNDQYTKFRKSLTSHLINCRKCLDKMQKLHNTVYIILGRLDSEIVTCFTLRDNVQDSIARSPDYIYADWPIEVQVFDESTQSGKIEATDSDPAPLQEPRKKLSMPSIRPFIKPAVAAAAVVLIAMLLLKAPLAQAVDLGQIYNALERIKSVYLATFDTEKPEPTQEIWISQSLNIKMLKTGTQLVLWDLKGKSQRVKNLNTDSLTTAELGEDDIVKVEETMELPWGMLPFSSISGVPADAKWQQIANGNIETAIPGTDVYDLMWVEKSLGGSIVYRKWRCYVDIGTKLPERIEWWQKYAKQEKYELLTVMKVAYPADVEIDAVIEDVGF
jgi:hypothetical protein